MNIDEIMAQKRRLDSELQIALSTMERKSVIYDLRMELLRLQKECPHFSAEHNFAIIDGKCPYCAAKILKGE